MTDGITREELHQELQAALEARFGVRAGAARWHPRNIFTPEFVERFVVTAAIVLVAGAVMWSDMKHEVSTIRDTRARDQAEYSDAFARTDKRIDDERAARQEADRRIESTGTRAIEEIKRLLEEQNRDIKEILRTMPNKIPAGK